MYSKLLSIFLFLFLFTLHKTYPQSPSFQLQKADSLFDAGKYTDAFPFYENILNRSELYSFQMLLKMAFIKEGTGDYTSALYYLNLYYNYNPNKKVLQKMEELAAKYKLTGYRYTDLEYFISLYNQYYYYIIFFFLAFALSYFIHLLLKKLRKKRIGFRPLIFILLLGLAYLLTNYDIVPPKGIINKSGTFLMSAPSAAAEPIASIDEGHRIMIVGKEDVWYRIIWEDQSAYVLESNLWVPTSKSHIYE